MSGARLEKTPHQAWELAAAARVLEALLSRVLARRVPLSDAVACALAVATKLTPSAVVARGSNATN